jgi:SulP family sulfate permease
MSLVTLLLETFGIQVQKLDAVNLSEWTPTYPVLDFHQTRLLIGTAVAIAILSLLEGVSIGKSLAARSGGKLDANQEMFNMGVANLGCSFLGGMPASGSLTRSMLSWKSGAKSPLASLFTGLLVILAAGFFGPYLSYVPKPALAVLVITIGLSLLNKHQIFVVTHSTGSDRAVFLITLVGGLLLPLDIAIVLGTVTSIFLFLKKAARPDLIEYAFNEEGQLAERKDEKRKVLEISIVHVEGDLFFGSADLFRDQIRRVFEEENLKILVLRMKNAHILDATCVLAMEELINYMKENRRYLLISGVRNKIYSVIENSGILDKIGRENVFKEDPNNPTFSTALAMKRAQEILGGREANVTIYVNPTQEKAS